MLICCGSFCQKTGSPVFSEATTLILWSEIYANTEILSPIDRGTWKAIGEISKINDSSRVIELASGKGAFALFLAEKYRCRVDGYDLNQEFVDYSKERARILGLESKVKFAKSDINQLDVATSAYDLGICLGALYIFRSSGWNVLTKAVKPEGFMAISDMVCKKASPPKELVDVFFEETDQPLTLDDARLWYVSRGAKILREETCSLGAWFEYYDLTKNTLLQISRTRSSDREVQREVEEGLREERLFRKHGEEYIDYVTFIIESVAASGRKYERGP